jgi:hypothetical protein
MNQDPALPVYSGLMESEFHHSEAFLVFGLPEFSGQTMVVEPGTALGQMFFVSRPDLQCAEITFSKTDLAAEPAYREKSVEVGLRLLDMKKPFVLSTLTGVMSLSLSCPHCWVSITAAAEGGVPETHVTVQDFYQGYKTLRGEYHRALRHGHGAIS